MRKPHQLSLATGDGWIDNGGNLLFFGQSGTGKTHAISAISHALIDTGRRVLFCSTTDMVQKLQAARRDLSLPSMLDKLDKYDLIVLDDLSYVRKDQVETSALFELIAHRYERHSIAITANQPFSAWDNVFPDPAMTVAAIDRLVHDSTVIEMSGESYRKRSAVSRIHSTQVPTHPGTGAAIVIVAHQVIVATVNHCRNATARFTTGANDNYPTSLIAQGALPLQSSHDIQIPQVGAAPYRPS